MLSQDETYTGDPRPSTLDLTRVTGREFLDALMRRLVPAFGVRFDLDGKQPEDLMPFLAPGERKILLKEKRVASVSPSVRGVGWRISSPTTKSSNNRPAASCAIATSSASAHHLVPSGRSAEARNLSYRHAKRNGMVAAATSSGNSPWIASTGRPRITVGKCPRQVGATRAGWSKLPSGRAPRASA